MRPSRRGWLVGAVVLALSALACDPQQLAEESGGLTRLSIATGGTGGVYYPYGGGIAKVISDQVPGVEATAEVTAASVDNLKFVRDGQADLAFTTADTLADAVEGTGVFAGTPLPIRTLANLYKNYTQVVTMASGSIERIDDLAGRTISTGAAGSGTEVTALRVLRASGVDPETGIDKQSLGVSQSAEALKDGKIDAFFWSGGLPTAAILDLSHTSGTSIRLLANDRVLPALRETYQESLYVPGVVPGDTYAGIADDVGVVSVPNLLVVREDMSEALAYAITEALFDRQPELESIHPEARHLTLETASEGSPAPYHPGAIQYYREHNAWSP